MDAPAHHQRCRRVAKAVEFDEWQASTLEHRLERTSNQIPRINRAASFIGEHEAFVSPGGTEPQPLLGLLYSVSAERRNRLVGERDLAGYLGNGRFVMVLPETDRAGALLFVERVRGFVPDIQAGVSGCPEDGRTFSELYETAAARLPDDERPPPKS